jgi:type I restriction enzyme, S subunit
MAAIASEQLIETEVGPMPASWQLARLGDLFETQLGKMLSPKAKTGISPRPYLRNANVQWGRIQTEDLLEMDFSPQEQAKFRLVPGDLLICEGGEVGRAALWHGEMGECYFQKAIHRLRPTDGRMENEFLLYHFMNAFLLQDTYGTQGTETTIAHLPAVKLRALQLPVPPIEEQRAIANVIRTVQRAKEAAEAVVAAVRQLKRSLLRHLFTYGPIPVDQAERVLLKETEVGPIPEHWRLAKIGEVARLSTGTTPSTQRSDYYKGTVPFIKTGEIANNRISRSETHVSEPAVRDYNLKLYPPGTVLLAMYGQGKTRGQAGLLGIEATTTQNTAAIVPSGELQPEYLWQFLLGQYERLRGTGMHGHISHLNLRYVRDYPIPIPPKTVQGEICTALAAADAKNTAEQSRVDALDTLFKTLLRDLMTGRVRVHNLKLTP